MHGLPVQLQRRMISPEASARGGFGLFLTSVCLCETFSGSTGDKHKAALSEIHFRQGGFCTMAVYVPETNFFQDFLMLPPSFPPLFGLCFFHMPAFSLMGLNKGRCRCAPAQSPPRSGQSPFVGYLCIFKQLHTGAIDKEGKGIHRRYERYEGEGRECGRRKGRERGLLHSGSRGNERASA